MCPQALGLLCGLCGRPKGNRQHSCSRCVLSHRQQGCAAATGLAIWSTVLNRHTGIRQRAAWRLPLLLVVCLLL